VIDFLHFLQAILFLLPISLVSHFVLLLRRDSRLRLPASPSGCAAALETGNCFFRLSLSLLPLYSFLNSKLSNPTPTILDLQNKKRLCYLHLVRMLTVVRLCNSFGYVASSRFTNGLRLAWPRLSLSSGLWFASDSCRRDTIVVCGRVFVKRLWCVCVCLCDWFFVERCFVRNSEDACCVDSILLAGFEVVGNGFEIVILWCFCRLLDCLGLTNWNKTKGELKLSIV